MTSWQRFARAFGVWEEARPYLPVMVDQDEVNLVLALDERAATVQEVAERLELGLGEAEALLWQAYGRHIVDKEVEGESVRYGPGRFDHFLDYFAKHGAWDQIPPQARQALDRRFLNQFISQQRPKIEAMRRGLAVDESPPNDTVLLLAEVEEMIEAATHIVVEPCDCRRLGQNCERPVETCIWMDDLALEALDRGHGRALTRAQALDRVRWADKRGLMHTGDAEWRARGLGAICNCCACDCYPFRAAQVLGSKGIWPKIRHVAVYDPDRCNQCGACVRRCHFQAYFYDGSHVTIEGKQLAQVRFEPQRCWGCGLCANSCPSDAIVLARLGGEGA